MNKYLFLFVTVLIAACSTPESQKDSPVAAGFIDEATINSAVENIKKVVIGY